MCFSVYCFLCNIVHKIHSCYCEFLLIVYFHYCLIFHAMHILQFVYSFCFDGHWSYFQLLPITGNIGMDILVPILYRHRWSFLFVTCPGLELLVTAYTSFQL